MYGLVIRIQLLKRLCRSPGPGLVDLKIGMCGVCLVFYF